MKTNTLLAIALYLFLAGTAYAQDPNAVSKAEASAVQWLKLMDSADYSATWDQAAGLFKAAVPKADWESAIRGVRAPLGEVMSRKVKSAQFTRSLPGAPDGEYVVIQFETRFANKAAAVETVTPMKDEDGYWRVSGYYIK
ncbi:DUF4019 domain-containing protein [Desulfonatronum sp. SC1]|uniref:DUF4019 domain-containing protein n=1 Tax=Desulfonatronum sp. SC1 TaxID=2109626 RepID=UPI000D32076E|nr:DUF4019 domain-containing protein [Desulfonatronum sp. SC1]PTN38241.1 hypothetical protein C6366_03215 [Desulfonatronum sp. SC1]